MRLWTPVAALFLVACFDSHGRFGDSPAPEVGPPPAFDVGPPPTPFDGGPTPVPFDADPPPPFDAEPSPLDAFVWRPDATPPDAMPPDGRVPPRDATPTRPDTGLPEDAGPPRPALRFSRGTFMRVDDAPPFDTSFSHTYEAWVRSREVADAEYCSKGDATSRHLVVGQRAGRYVMGWELAGTDRFVEGPPVRPDTWVHLALVVRPAPGGHEGQIYVDGTLFATSGLLPGLVDSFNDIGFRCGFADADVDEVRVWRVARSAASISTSFRAQISGAVPGLVAYWRMDERGQFVTDYTARGHIGVLGNRTTADPADPTWILDGPF
ncbi:MAG: hypothetical protein SangKO_016780 [Sandaracinaceae bacterium]